jgi:hypothetical protein
MRDPLGSQRYSTVDNIGGLVKVSLILTITLTLLLACSDQSPQSVNGSWIADDSITTRTLTLVQNDTLVTGNGDYTNHVARLNASIVISGTFHSPILRLKMAYLGFDTSSYRAVVNGTQMSGIETFMRGSVDTLAFAKQ